MVFCCSSPNELTTIWKSLWVTILEGGNVWTDPQVLGGEWKHSSFWPKLKPTDWGKLRHLAWVGESNGKREGRSWLADHKTINSHPYLLPSPPQKSGISIIQGEVVQLFLSFATILFSCHVTKVTCVGSAECLQSITHIICKYLSITMVWNHPQMASIALSSPKSNTSLLAYSMGFPVFTDSFCFFSI